MDGKLTSEKIKKLRHGMRRTFETIAPDILNELGVLSRKAVVEIVLDADYLESYGGLDENLVKEFRALSFDDQDKIALQEFTASRYS